MVAYPTASLAKSSGSTESEESFGSTLGRNFFFLFKVRPQFSGPGKSKGLGRPELGVGCRSVLHRPPHHTMSFPKGDCKNLLGSRSFPGFLRRYNQGFWLPGPGTRLARRRTEEAAGGGDAVQTLPAQEREGGEVIARGLASLRRSRHRTQLK